MAMNWQNLNKPENVDNKSPDVIKKEPALRVIQILQKAGFCVYHSDDQDEDLIFVVPVTTDACFPHSLFSRN